MTTPPGRVAVLLTGDTWFNIRKHIMTGRERNKISCFPRDQFLSDLLYIGSRKFIKHRCKGGRRST